jgi:hypothetical protein
MKNWTRYLSIAALVLAALAPAADTGWVLGGTAVDGGGGDAGTWTSPSNVNTDDTAYSEVVPESRNVGPHLEVTNFSFGIPSGATIDGVEFRVRAYAESSTEFPDWNIQILKAGTRTGTDKSVAGDWPGTATTRDYGGIADLWAVTLTETDVSSSTFGISFQIEDDASGDEYFRVEAIWMKITYTASGGGGATGAEKANGFFALINQRRRS